MELEMTGGQYVPRRTGGVATVSGTQETAQRIAMKLGARRGGFVPMPDYGSRMYALLSRVKPSERADAAKAYAAEALSDEPGVTVEGAEVVPDGEGGAAVTLTLSYDGDTLDVALTV